MNIYAELTRKFNHTRLRAVLAGGQAVVLHRLAVMSKDGDWILREDDETMDHVRGVLGAYGARYRFGAPLDARWLAGGWSSHLEFTHANLRVRTDFTTRPPRLSDAELGEVWRSQEGRDLPRVDPRALAELKKTNREKDYAVIGELARLLTSPDDKILYSRSARDLLALADRHPDRITALVSRRPALEALPQGLSALEAALDAERRALIHANEQRLERYMAAAEPWADAWPEVAREMEGHSLESAHRLMCQRAERLLPFTPEESP